MLLALRLVVYIAAIGVAAGALLVAIEALEPNPSVGLGAQGSHHGCGRRSGVEPVALLRCLIVHLDLGRFLKTLFLKLDPLLSPINGARLMSRRDGAPHPHPPHPWRRLSPKRARKSALGVFLFAPAWSGSSVSSWDQSWVIAGQKNGPDDPERKSGPRTMLWSQRPPKPCSR
jgi:hypothetical protein